MKVLGRSLQDRNLKYYNATAAFLVSIVLNFILVYTVLKKTPKWLHPYAKIFLTDSFINVCFITMCFLSNVVLINVNDKDSSYFIHITSGVLNDLPQPWTTIITGVYVFFLNWTITIVPVNFVYRYLSVCHDYEISISGFIFITLISTIAPGIYAVSTVVYEFQGEIFKDKLTYLFNDTDWLSPDGTPPHFAVMEADSNNIHNYVIPIAALISYIIVVLCAIQIWRKFYRLRKLQDKYVRKSYSLNVVLITNAVVPLLVQVVPSGGAAVARLFGFNMPPALVYISMVSPWSAAISPLMDLIVVQPYRHFVFCRRKGVAPKGQATSRFAEPIHNPKK
uniref:G-protein coupled receptors family 1 profile domain-containing protein n=1 Tax=Panagrellus redivivus TaxID=6233 RepID=A0A7E4W5L1_PANRE